MSTASDGINSIIEGDRPKMYGRSLGKSEKNC